MNRRQFLRAFSVTAAGVALPLPFVAAARDAVLVPAAKVAAPEVIKMSWREAMMRGAGCPRPRYLAMYGSPGFRNDFEFADNWIIERGTMTYGDKLRMVATQECTLQRFEMLLADGEVLYRGTIGAIGGERGADMLCCNTHLMTGSGFVVDHLALTLLPGDYRMPG